MRLVEIGKLEPCRTIDLGWGIGENVIYLAQRGFEATGTDISSRAIAKARRKAQTAQVLLPFREIDKIFTQVHLVNTVTFTFYSAE